MPGTSFFKPLYFAAELLISVGGVELLRARDHKRLTPLAWALNNRQCYSPALRAASFCAAALTTSAA